MTHNIINFSIMTLRFIKHNDTRYKALSKDGLDTSQNDTHNITTLSMMTVSITTLSITGLI